MKSLHASLVPLVGEHEDLAVNERRRSRDLDLSFGIGSLHDLSLESVLGDGLDRDSVVRAGYHVRNLDSLAGLDSDAAGTRDGESEVLLARESDLVIVVIKECDVNVVIIIFNLVVG